MTNRYKYWLIGLGIVGLVALLSWLWIDYRTTGTTILATHFNRDRAVLIHWFSHSWGANFSNCYLIWYLLWSLARVRD
ncbi:hypothetical protein OE230_03970 [Levilactobacillus brevis]|nr:hypothetical protein OE230_03970 [Levilactobacillus brevis]